MPDVVRKIPVFPLATFKFLIFNVPVNGTYDNGVVTLST